METKPINEGLIARYLLGDLPEEEQVRIEDRAFADREYLQDILAVEADLIDEYVRGELSDFDRRQFESRFLTSSERRQKVEFARALAKVVPETATENVRQAVAVQASISWWDSFVTFLRSLNPALKLSMAAAAVVLTIGVSWLVRETVRLRWQVAKLQAEQLSRQRQEEDLQRQIAGERSRNEELARQVQGDRSLEKPEKTEKPDEPPLIATLFLPAGISRSAVDRPILIAPQGAQTARLQVGLEPGDEYESFRAELRTRAGREVWRRQNLPARSGRGGRFLTLNVPVNILNTGEYELTLKGISGKEKVEDLGYYYFDVLKK